MPVDSEHSALAQACAVAVAAEVRRLVLTASGGPFRGRRRERPRRRHPDQALAHPTWDMGPVVTINSATLVNKGLEVIEAHLLFDVPLERIDVVVHPQSVVHSMVEFVDGSTLAQASPPDMRLPIALGLGWPDRVPRRARLRLDEGGDLELRAARRRGVPGRTAGACGGRVAAGRRPAVFNAANEECVEAFLGGALGLPRHRRHRGPGARQTALSGTSDRRRCSRCGGVGPTAGPRADPKHEPGPEPPARMTYAVGVIFFALGILLSVCLHEAGHLLTAKRFGMKATQYFAGFGPTLWSFRRGETEYGFKAIPAGGFVKIVGMTPLEEIAPEDQPRAF